MFKMVNIILVLVLLFVVGCKEPSSPVSPNKNIENFAKPSQMEILKAINQARSKARDCHDGLGIVGPSQPLSLDDRLYLSAYEHGQDLAYSHTFSHEGSGTEYDITGYDLGKASLFYERIEAQGYVDYKIVGENIAGGHNSIDKVMKAWLDSPKHCTNIMNPKFSQVGIAIVIDKDSEYGIYWVQNFGG
jgi:uncharacterized protein YkwD